MRNSWLIAVREWKARVVSRSFIIMSFFGPLMILALTFVLFAYGGEGKQKWNVLVTDPTGLMESRMIPDEDGNVTYSFADGYIEHEDFRDGNRYQKFDAMIEINEKVVSNKVGFIFYREAPSVRMQTTVQYQIERRIEQIMVSEFTDFSTEDYLRIKQALKLGFRDVYDPENQSSNLSGWAGFFYGGLIFIFIFLFGMTILRSITHEKSNRIVEVLLASVSPNQLMIGKIIGIGMAAIIQFVIWLIIIGIGLYFMRENLFPDMMDARNIVSEQALSAMEYNRFVEFIYTDVDFGMIVPFFILFFLVGYLFYGSLFAAVGATMGTESDGQQFVIPIIFMLIFALYSGYYVMYYPESELATWFYYLPLTSPVVVMVKLAQDPVHSYELYLSLFILIVSSLIVLRMAGRLYRNGILQFGHRVRLKHLAKWLRRT